MNTYNKYSLISVVNNKIEFTIDGLSYEQAVKKAESIARIFGYTRAENAPMRFDGILFCFGEDSYIKILHESGVSPVEWVFS